MGRKRVDINQAAKRPTDRQLIWQSIRKRGTFTYLDIEEDTRINMDTIRTYVTGLLNAGYLKQVKDKRKVKRPIYQRATFELIKDTGVDAPRVTKAGKEVTQGVVNEQMWRTMKMLGNFTHKDLAVHASTDENKVSVDTAKTYCRLLAKAGYLAERQASQGPKPAIYRFIKSRNTGPQAPMIQRIKQVFDPNTNEVVWRPQ